MDEEHRLIADTVGRFSEKELQPSSLATERLGISKSILQATSSLGLLAPLAAVEHGGASLDRLGYVIILHEVSKVSPSLGFYILIQNSMVMEPLMKYGDQRQRGRIAEIAEGRISGTLVYSELLGMKDPGRVQLSAERIEGCRNGVLNSSADIFLVRVDPSGDLYFVEQGFKKLDEHERLGFRGIRFSPVEFSLNSVEATRMGDKSGEAIVQEALDSAALAFAAVALGIAEGALSKAKEYAKEREAFLHKLKDFQPLAFSVTDAYAEMDALKEYLFLLARNQQDLQRELMAKDLLVDFAKRATKLSLQIYGGYGYFDDTGIEKFYRDAMFLSIVCGNDVREKMRLSEMVFGSKAGYV